MKKKKMARKKIIRTNFNNKLFIKLKKSRDLIAETKGVANFIILNDNVLKEISYYYPKSKDEFLHIKGIGENKFDKFGKIFLSLINEFEISSSDLKSRHKELRKSVKIVSKINIKERTAIRKKRVMELILKKVKIEDIAGDLKLTNQTIVNYIERLIEDNSNIDINYIKNSIEGYNDIVKSFAKHGTEKIGTIYADFAGMVEYSNIILVRVLLKSK